MSEIKNASTATAPEATASKPRGERKSFGVVLRDAAGNTMRVIARKGKDGTAIVFSKHTVKDAAGKKHSKRGATTKHPDLASAKTRAAECAKVFEADGWRASTRSAPEPKSDAFTMENRPKPVTNAPAAPADGSKGLTLPASAGKPAPAKK